MRALAALLLLGCSEKTDLLPHPDAGCSGPVSLGNECAAAAAAKRLRYALCSCSPLILPRALFTQGGSDMGGPPPAAVGSDQQVQISGPVQVAGVLEAAGSFGASFGRTAGIAGSLRSGGTLSSNLFLAVDGDAFVNGDVLGRMEIGGVLHAPDSAFISPAVVADGGISHERVAVNPPCDCGAAPDLAGAIATHSKLNDDAAIHLSPDALAGGQPILDLPCGAFFLSQIKTPPDVELELRVHGFTALFVAGDVHLSSGLRVVLDAGAELDLVIGGDLFAPTGMIGAPSAERFRLWLGGKTLALGHGAALSASIYAPIAVVQAEGDLNVVNGALFAAGISAIGDVGVHYDADLLAVGASCGAPPEPPVE
jgi:hypothetical protein